MIHAILGLINSMTIMASAQGPEVTKPRQKIIGGAVQVANVYFVEPQDGATVAQKFTVKMAVEGLKVRPAGEAPDDVASGHHHILVDTGSIAAGIPIPADAKHLHFGKGQTETEITLKPGKHALTLQFADGAHRSYGEKLSQTITITVK